LQMLVSVVGHKSLVNCGSFLCSKLLVFLASSFSR
jgi:hypothetical protein